MYSLQKKNVKKNIQTNNVKNSNVKPETDSGVKKSSNKLHQVRKDKIVKHVPKKGKSILSGGKKIK